MKKDNKTKKIIIAVVVSILVLLAILACIFFMTDIFLNDKQAFLKYAAQVYNQEKGFAQDELGAYFEKRNNTPLKNEGGFSVNVSSKEGESKYNVLNNCNFLFNGKMDKKNNKVEQNLTIKYSEEATFPIQYKKIDGKEALKLEDIASKSIIYKDGDKITTKESLSVNNETNANNNANNSGNNIVNSEEILENDSNSLDYESLLLGDDKFNISKEDKREFQKSLALGIVKRLNKDKFSKVYEENVGYRLTLTQKEIKTILTNTLEEIKVQKQDNKNLVDYINSLIKKVNKSFEVDEENKTVSVTVYQKNGKIAKLSFEADKSKIDITKGNGKEGKKYVIKYTSKEKKPYLKSITLDTTFGGLNELSKVYENYKLVLEFSDKEYEYKLNNLVEFKDSVDIEDFNDSNSVNLNNYKPRNVINFFNAVGKQLKLNHKKLMAEIGLNESQNPLMYIIPSFESTSTENDNLQLDSDEADKVNEFNAKFEKYEGGNVKGVTIKGLFRVVKSTNEDKANNNGYNINSINFNGEEKDTSEESLNYIIAELDKDKNKEYKVKFEKNPTIGVIDGIIIMDKDKALVEDEKAAKEENKKNREKEKEEKEKNASEIDSVNNNNSNNNNNNN